MSLVALEVRKIGLRREGNNPIVYAVDVVADPIGTEHPALPENPAHAEIRTDPTIASDGVFKRLRRSLALLANQRGWLIPPDKDR